MDRRDVLKLGVVAASTSGCATMVSAHPGMTDGDMGAFLSSLDANLDRLGNASILQRFFEGSKKPVTQTPDFARKEALARKTLRSLLLVGTLRELPEERMAHPGVQQRLRDSMGEFDSAMFGMTDLLETLTPTQRADIAGVLREDPDLGMKVMGAIDSEAASYGVAMEGRLKLRSLSAHATSRLKQSPDLVIEEYVTKMHKLAARHGLSEQYERELATSVGEQLLWQGEAPPEQEAAGGSTKALTPPPPPPMMPAEGTGTANGTATGPTLAPGRGPASTPAEAAAARRKKTGKIVGTSLLAAGGISLGVAAVSFGLAAAVGSGGGAILITVGALLGILGLIVLLVGLIVFLANL